MMEDSIQMSDVGRQGDVDVSCDPFSVVRKRSTRFAGSVRSVGARMLVLLGFMVSAASATPLDDKIAAFKQADTQTEAAAAELLQIGLGEFREAEALAVVRPWLSANTPSSQSLLFHAGRSMHYAGDWSDAVIFYRKLLKSKALDARLAGIVAPAVYRLLISDMRDEESAYLFMREDGNRLRQYGRAKQFDQWFMRKALERNDVQALVERLAAIYADPKENPAEYAGFMKQLYGRLEQFDVVDKDTVEALDTLARVATREPLFKVRWNWIHAASVYNPQAVKLFGQAVPAELLAEPIKAARALIAADPMEGPKLVVKGWSRWNQGDTPTFFRFVHSPRDLKAAVFFDALQQFSPEQAKAFLEMGAHGPRGRWVPVAGFLSAAQAKVLVPRFPTIFNAIDAPAVELWDKDLTLAEAGALAPHLARNPHPHAALVRAYAAAGTNTVSAIVPAMMKSERWRFPDAKTVVDMVWNAGFDRSGADHRTLVGQYEKQGDRYDQLQKQVAKEADSKTRMAAFQSLYQELRGGTYATPGLLSLWDACLTQAPNDDKQQMLRKLVADVVSAPPASVDLQTHLLRQALEKIDFGNPYSRLSFGPGFAGGWDRWGFDNVRKALPALATDLGTLLRQQLTAGTLSEPLFSMWLHCVDPKQPEAKALLEELVKSPAYAGMHDGYHQMAAHQLLFGAEVLPVSPTDPSVISRELLDLPEDAAPALVQAALKTVLTRAAQASEPVTVIGLRKVAALPELDGEPHQLALTLFDGLAPLTAYPAGQGYEQLALRLIKTFRESGEWGRIVPHAASLWRCANSPDSNRGDHFYHVVEAALMSYADDALEAGHVSAAQAVARNGLFSGVPLEAMKNRLRAVVGRASVALGVVEIPVDETDPAYGIYKSNSEFVIGNLDTAWGLYLEHAAVLLPREGTESKDEKPLIRKLTVEYGFWLVARNIAEGRTGEAEALVKALSIWARDEAGLLSLEQDAELKLAYADLAFRKGALPTARAWFRKVADAREYNGSMMQVRAVLGSVMIDRVSKDFGTALEELDRLQQIKVPGASGRIHYARAEVFMDQEAYKEALSEVESVLRSEPGHEDARILRGKIEILMRRLVEASEIELGLTRENKVMVPGEVLKINLFDPALNVSGVGADIEVEVWAKSGDRERVMLHQLGDNKERFRADVPTALAPPVAGDKTLQVLGIDEIRYGYSKRFREKMKDLPADPDTVITIASDAYLSFSAGAFPPREGERSLDIEELGLSSAQRKLGMRTVRPGNPVYVRVVDADQSKTAGVDKLPVSLETSSGDVIRRLLLDETGPYTGEFQGIIPTAGAQAMAFASEMAPARDPNMAISAKEYPGWLGNVGEPDKARTFGVDFNDNVPLGKMTIQWLAEDQAISHFVLQTSFNGRDWITRARYPKDEAPWDGRPQVRSIPTYRGGIPVTTAQGVALPPDWQEKMELSSARPSCNFLAAVVTNFPTATFPVVDAGHPDYSVLLQVRALFYQPVAAVRRFRVAGWPSPGGKESSAIFLLDGLPAEADAEDPMTIERELQPGLHEIQIWRHTAWKAQTKGKPDLLCDVPGKEELQPCPASMFDPATFPAGVQAMIPQVAAITNVTGGVEIAFGDRTQARLVRLSIQGFQGVAPGIKQVTLTGRDDKAYLPVEQDFMALRENKQLEVLPGDQIIVRYEDEVSASPKRNRHEARLGVAFNTATITASFLNYETTASGRQLLLEPIRRFNLEDAVAIVIDDVDMDGSPEKDVVTFTAQTSSGEKTVLKAVETEAHSGRFIGRIFPVTGKPQRESELQVPEGGTLTLTYRDEENLDPGIPTDRSVTIEHARYVTPRLGAYTAKSEWIQGVATAKKGVSAAPSEKAKAGQPQGRRATGPEVFHARRTLAYNYVAENGLADTPLTAVIDGSVMFDVVAPHLALAGSSAIQAYVQVVQADASAPTGTPAGREESAAFDITLPGTIKLAGSLGGGGGAIPRGYKAEAGRAHGSGVSALDEGRFIFSVPLLLGDRPQRSFATQDAELSGAMTPEGLVVQAGDTVRIGYAWKDEAEHVQWKVATVTVGSHAFLDVMNAAYSEPLESLFVGERLFLRVLAPGLDRGPERDVTSVELKAAASGASTRFSLRETEAHSGVFKGVFTVKYADETLPETLPPVELNGFPVRYGDDVTVTYAAAGEDPEQAVTVAINTGADGTIEPFSKRFTGDEMAVMTGFTMAECFFELAKQHRKMDQESLARREMAHARKLLQEAIATHRDDELRAQAEYLLGNLSQEYADLSQNEEAKLPAYQEALARFIKIPVDYPDTKFAHKAQFKTGLVYEKMGEGEIAVEEYVKLAYKYPGSEHIPEVMTRLGKYFQGMGQALKEQADALRDKQDVESQSEVLRLDELSYPEFMKAAVIYGKLQQRFPDHNLAGLAGLASAQNYMRAHQYETAVAAFEKVVENENYDDADIRAQALYWSGLSCERMAAASLPGDYRGRGGQMGKAYEIYRRVTFDFPDSKWAKYARGRLSDPAFAQRITEDNQKRETLLETLRLQKAARAIKQKDKEKMDKLLNR